MTPDDIEALFRFKGGHAMARMAASPGTAVSDWKTSSHGYYGGMRRVDTEKDGIRFTDLEADTSHVITWGAIRGHALEHTTEEIRDWIVAVDSEWCRVKSMPDVPPGQWRYHTDQEKQRIASCERWLVHLARTVWDPALVAPPEPVQLDMLALLEEMTS